ncbi:unnamed protein product, partial [Polarella glacialis]
ASGIDVFLVSLKAGGVGLNLTAADKVILMDLSFNPQDNRQAEDRAHRLGQTRPVQVIYMVTAETMEEKVVKANIDKMALDYKFGGQKSALKGAPSSGLSLAPEATVADEEDEGEEGDDGADEVEDKKEAKAAEAEAIRDLERQLGL